MYNKLGLHEKVTRGFTIVELIIVIIVVAILATLVTVSYNGIISQSKETSLKTDLEKAASDIEGIYFKDGAYPSSPALTPSEGNNLAYSNWGVLGFCVSATNPGLADKAFHITQDSTVKDGACPVPPLTNGMAMQSVTQGQCQALTVYTGTNESALRTLTDNRGGTTRSYTVGKLADNKCWMLDNLKLGSTTSSITLTPSDSNVTANFVLPQVLTTSSTATSGIGNGYDTPYAYGPVSGDTGSGSTNYGYLYNWSAATAGANRTTHPAGSGAAQSSICPANWRLPTGGATGEFAMLNAKMNNPSATTPSASGGAGYRENWQNNGSFKGALSGDWWGSFDDQGTGANLWSRSASTSSADNAHISYFGAGIVDPVNSIRRNYGFGVRCLLN